MNVSSPTTRFNRVQREKDSIKRDLRSTVQICRVARDVIRLLVTSPWLRSITRPFLNEAAIVTRGRVLSYSDPRQRDEGRETDLEDETNFLSTLPRIHVSFFTPFFFKQTTILRKMRRGESESQFVELFVGSITQQVHNQRLMNILDEEMYIYAM